MTPERLREIILATGRNRPELARMLGYRSENSLRQAEAGMQTIPADKAQWLERYAELRSRHADQESAWLKKNPPPDEKRY
jgi:hypothetical protein